MLFNLESDSGTIIEGYLVPDGFSEQPGIRVLHGETEVLAMDCDQHRQAVVASGRHATGLIGFRLTEALLPSLGDLPRLSIVDRKTGMLIYRRPPDNVVDMKVCRLETRQVPLRGFDTAMENRFQYWASSVERFGQETALQAFHLNAIGSIFISGRLLFRNFEEFLDKGFCFTTMLSEPFRDMAERITFFHQQARSSSVLVGERDRMIIEPAVAHFATVDIDNPKALRRALRSANDQVRRNLISPLTRQLVATHPEQAVSRPSIAAAMDSLSRFAVVGLRECPEIFTYAFAELTSIPPEELPAPAEQGSTADLADHLRAMPEAETLVECDLILYHFARDSLLRHANASLRDGG